MISQEIDLRIILGQRGFQTCLFEAEFSRMVLKVVSDKAMHVALCSIIWLVFLFPFFITLHIKESPGMGLKYQKLWLGALPHLPRQRVRANYQAFIIPKEKSHKVFPENVQWMSIPVQAYNGIGYLLKLLNLFFFRIIKTLRVQMGTLWVTGLTLQYSVEISPQSS